MGGNPAAVNIISYNISYIIPYHIYRIVSYHISYCIIYIISYRIISYHISYRIIYIISYRIVSYHIIYHINVVVERTVTVFSSMIRNSKINENREYWFHQRYSNHLNTKHNNDDALHETKA